MYLFKAEYLMYAGVENTDEDIYENLEHIAKHMKLEPELSIESNEDGEGYGYIQGRYVTFSMQGYMVKFKVYEEV